MRRILSLVIAMPLMTILSTANAPANAEPMIGEIRHFAGNFAPRGWSFCQGQLLPISQNTALYSIIGTLYGGDGRTVFALPDARGRTLVGAGNGPGLQNIRLSERSGIERAFISNLQMPSHTHDTIAPAESIEVPIADGDDANTALVASAETQKSTSGSEGGSQLVPVRDPYLAVNCIIATEGVYPSRQ